MCVHRLPFSNELGFLSHFPPLAIVEARDGEPNGLTMVAFMKQFGTGWEEDVGELRDLPDYVHCSQNSLQRSGGSERAEVCWDAPPSTSATWQIMKFLDGQVPRVLPSHLLAHISAGFQKQFLYLSSQVPAHLSRAHGAQSAQGQALYSLHPLTQVTAVLGGWSVKPLRNPVLPVPIAGSPLEFSSSPLSHLPDSKCFPKPSHFLMLLVMSRWASCLSSSRSMAPR